MPPPEPPTLPDGKTPVTTPRPDGAPPVPPPPPPRMRHTTAQDLQAASQEVIAEGLVPTEEAVERRATLKRAGRTETRVIRLEDRTRRLFTWQTIALLSFVTAAPKLIEWCEKNAGMWGGAVGVIAIILGGIYSTVRLVRLVRAEPADAGDDEPPPPPSVGA